MWNLVYVCATGNINFSKIRSVKPEVMFERLEFLLRSCEEGDGPSESSVPPDKS
jgi:hypothetical protein